jgi:hypothetical protein
MLLLRSWLTGMPILHPIDMGSGWSKRIRLDAPARIKRRGGHLIYVRSDTEIDIEQYQGVV